METSDYIFMMPASLTGAPAAVVPLGLDAGLPIAVQVVAHLRRDDIALGGASAIERSR